MYPDSRPGSVSPAESCIAAENDSWKEWLMNASRMCGGQYAVVYVWQIQCPGGLIGFPIWWIEHSA